ncbi:hypothetical protein F511_12733 [Dorcoceras hygrometricum]|uniref:Uncharacterized protein n=1 Tax=Dorcoceras hygrometricum TaxID=472368 RepID=A0A2Z7AQ57_9LAMI|nr:hypothetical protein F511_12733 [Dorcoceras hygrometricum]
MPPVSRGNRHFTVDCGRQRQSAPRPDTGFLRQPALEGLTRSAWTDSPQKIGRNTSGERRQLAAAAAESFERREAAVFGSRDTASRGPTTIVVPESQFRTCPSDHGIEAIGHRRPWRAFHRARLCSRNERARCAAWRVDMREPLLNTAAGSALLCAALGERLRPPRAFLLRAFAPLHSARLLRAMADDERRFSRFISRGRAYDALLAARCRLLDGPPGRCCARSVAHDGAYAAADFVVAAPPSPTGDAPASFRRCRDGWSEFF